MNTISIDTGPFDQPLLDVALDQSRTSQKVPGPPRAGHSFDPHG